MLNQKVSGIGLGIQGQIFLTKENDGIVYCADCVGHKARCEVYEDAPILWVSIKALCSKETMQMVLEGNSAYDESNKMPDEIALPWSFQNEGIVDAMARYGYVFFDVSHEQAEQLAVWGVQSYCKRLTEKSQAERREKEYQERKLVREREQAEREQQKADWEQEKWENICKGLGWDPERWWED